MYAIFKNGKDIYTRSYSTWSGNWVGSSTNRFGQRCAYFESPKPAVWKTREAAERNAEQLRRIQSPAVCIEVQEIGPRNVDIERAALKFSSEMFDAIATSDFDRANDIIREVIDVAMGSTKKQ